VTWRQARRAIVSVTVEASSGAVVRRLAARRFEPGTASLVWDGRRRDHRLAPTGIYRVRITARNDAGKVTLERPIRVVRLPPKG
jgi:flagellar hook assembly protein FlgD